MISQEAATALRCSVAVPARSTMLSSSSSWDSNVFVRFGVVVEGLGFNCFSTAPGLEHDEFSHGTQKSAAAAAAAGAAEQHGSRNVTTKIAIITATTDMMIFVIMVTAVFLPKLVPAKTPNSMDVKIGKTHAIVQCLLWCPAACRLGKIKPRKISCCCCRFDVLLFLFVLCRHAHCEVTRQIY